jgi:hypothetical protein
MKKYIAIECGYSAYTEFLMKNGEYEETCDCILVCRVKAKNKAEAENKILNSEEHKNKKFNKLLFIEIK